MGADTNPYDWQGQHPKHLVSRERLLAQAVEMCRSGRGVLLLLGTRGMGKSVFLGHLDQELRHVPEIETVVFSTPPLARGTASDLLSALCGELGQRARRRQESVDVLEEELRNGPKRGRVDDDLEKALRNGLRRGRVDEVLRSYLAFSTDIERLVLLYDELDKYADPPAAGRDYFNALERARQDLDGRLVVVAAGGVGMLSLKHDLGSPMFARAERAVLEPFSEDRLRELSQPIEDAGVELPPDLLPTLHVLSGGNLALATYGLQNVWAVKKPSSVVLTQAFDNFRDKHNDFCANIRSNVFNFGQTAIALEVWKNLKSSGGQLSRSQMAEIRTHAGGRVLLENKDILDMLRASGLILMDDSAWRQDPILANIIPSVLSLGFDDLAEEHRCSSLRDQLQADFREALLDIHRMTPAFYRPGSKARQAEKQLVPEATFAAGLALSLGGRGWKAELEPMSAAGFADIKARHPRFGEEEAIVEVKLWRNEDRVTIHEQVTSYFARGVTVLATVVITDHKDQAWKDEYRRQCLEGKVDGDPVWHQGAAPLEGWFEAHWDSGIVDHFLLRLASR